MCIHMRTHVCIKKKIIHIYISHVYPHAHTCMYSSSTHRRAPESPSPWLHGEHIGMYSSSTHPMYAMYVLLRVYVFLLHTWMMHLIHIYILNFYFYFSFYICMYSSSTHGWCTWIMKSLITRWKLQFLKPCGAPPCQFSIYLIYLFVIFYGLYIYTHMNTNIQFLKPCRSPPCQFSIYLI